MRSRFNFCAEIAGTGWALGCLLALVLLADAAAQKQVTADPQHGAGTRLVLPAPEKQFTGKIGRTTVDSESAFPIPVSAPSGAPNVLLIMTDDVGFGASSTFGGPIPTPNFDRLAARGIKYNRFHTTALCSPTRAALITGRNHHNAHTGIIMERSLGYPGYDSVMPKSCGTVAEILKQNGSAWDSLKGEQKELYARMMEVFAAYLAFCDHNIGRVIKAVEETGELDNTLIVYIQGDNGGSAEGTLQGTANELAVLGNGAVESLGYLLSIKEELGGPMHMNHFPVPWSWATTTPMQWTKRYASHFGGTRNGMVMSWPRKIKDVGTIRSQFHHVIDVAPTILDAAGVIPPESINGVAQRPIDGVGMAYTWSDPKAKGRRTTQYFELFGNRGIYHDGWMACTTPLVFAWEPEPNGLTPESFQWELYDIDKDFTQGHNIAKEHPEKLRELQELWWAEAGKKNVLPLNFSIQATLEAVLQKPSFTRGRTRFEYHQGTIRVPEGTSPTIKNRSQSN
jgi:arylsulfatase A-like enzyme